MKTILILFTLLIVSPAFAQYSDTLRYRNGLVLDYDGCLISNVGFKYRITPDWTPFFKIMWYINSNSSSNDSVNPTESSKGLRVTAGAEYKMFRLSDISFLTLASIGYMYRYSSESGNFFPSGEKMSVYSFTLGFAAEYFISKQFSVSGYETCIFSYSNLKYSHPQSKEIERSVEFGYNWVSLNFYF